MESWTTMKSSILHTLSSVKDLGHVGDVDLDSIESN